MALGMGNLLLLCAALVHLSALSRGQASAGLQDVELHVGGAGSCTFFDGRGDFVVLTQGGGLPCPPFTIEFWIQPLRLNPRVVLSHYSRWDSRTLFSVHDNGDTTSDGWTRGTNLTNDQLRLRAGPPYHWALVADAGAWSVYINGTKKHEINPPAESVERCASHTPAAYPWVLGCGVESQGSLLVPKGHSCFYGCLDDLRMWRKALTRSQIQGQMHTPPKEHEEGLVHRWGFDAKPEGRFSEVVPGLHNGDSVTAAFAPTLVNSPMPLLGGPVPCLPAIGETAECRICAAVVPPVTEARGTAHVQLAGSANGTLVTMGGQEVGSLEVKLEIQPFEEAVGLTVLCGAVHLRSWTPELWYIPFFVAVQFPTPHQNVTVSGAGSIMAAGDLPTNFHDVLPQELVVGRARAVQLAHATLELGTFDMPAAVAGASFAFSLWVHLKMLPRRSQTLARGPVQLEISLSDFVLNRATWATNWSSDSRSNPAQEVQAFHGLLAVNVRCAGDNGTAQLFVDGDDLGEQRTSGCWHPSSPWRLGDSGACNLEGDEYDDFHLWKRALTPTEVQGLYDGHIVAVDDLVARLTFDNIHPLQDCRELQKLGADTDGDEWCPDPTTSLVETVKVRDMVYDWMWDFVCNWYNLTNDSPWFEGGYREPRTVSVPSPFSRVPGSIMHRLLREGTHQTIRLSEDGSRPLTFALQDNSSIDGLALIEDLLSYSAPDLEGRARMTGKTLEVSFIGCDSMGACEPGVAMFHVQPRGPGITAFQVLPTSNMMRLFFSETTNTPNIPPERVQELFEFSGLPPEWPLPKAVEWVTNRSLQFHYPAASMWRLLPDLRSSSEGNPLANISLRVKVREKAPELWIRDPSELKYPCDDTATSELLICREGTSPQFGAPGCEGCKVGQEWSAREGCLPCEPGRYQPATGQVDCDHCPLGSYASEWGATSCELCESWLPGSTTAFQGMRSGEACICRAGHTWTRDAPTSTPRCRICAEGLLCPGGRQQLNETESASRAGSHHLALQAAGFSAGLPAWVGGEPTFLVRCSSRTRCPGGLELGTCPPLALGRACTQCASGSFLHKDRCRLCEEADETLSLSLPLAMLLLALLCLCWFSTRPPALFDEKTATLTTSSSVLFAAMQVVGALAISEVPWPEPIPTLKGWLDVIMLQVDSQGFQCFVNVGSSSNSYLGQLAMYPAVTTSSMLVLLLKRRLLKQQRNMPQIINMQGLALMSLFTSIAALSVTPLKCRTDNPDGSSTLEAHRSVVCWNSEEHRGMLGGSIAACLVFVVGFIAVVAWATLVHPSKVVAPNGGVHLARFRFLFWPYTPQRYYFGLLFGLRKLMVALAPLLVVNWAQGQLLLMIFVTCGNMVLQCSLWPWRTFKTNTLDALIAVMLVTLMATGFMLGDFDVVSDGTSAQNMVISSLALGFGLFLWTLAGYIMKLSRSRRYRTYRIFLSHHKVGAGLLARWVKMLLQECGVHPQHVFLDSDDLLHLDRLMHTVAYETDNVVVLLTGETLTRPWCAMEITAAYRSNVNVIPVLCDGHGQITDKFLDRLQALWTIEQQTTMASGGVETQDVRLAYTLLRAEEPLKLVRRGADVQTHLQLVRDVLARCPCPVAHRYTYKGGLSRTSLSLHGKQGSSQHLQSFCSAKVAARVAILSDVETADPACGCRVLQSLLQRSLQEAVVVSAELRQEFRHVLVLMGPDTLKSSRLARLLVQATEQPGVQQDLVPLLLDDHFEFPGPAFWSDLRAGHVFSHLELERLALTSARLEAAYRRLLNTLAMRFSGCASRAMQAAEVACMVSRIRARLSSSSPPSSKPSETCPNALERHAVTVCI